MTTTLVIDIGGTNTRVATAQGIQVDLATVQRFRNADVSGLGEVIASYRASMGLTPDAACVAGAGPVRDGVLRLTNLDWVVARDWLAEASGAAAVSILNDLQAQGHALEALPDSSITTLLQGKAASDQAAKLVINVGTGFNVAPVYKLKGQTLVPPSEAGHALLPAQTAQEQALVPFLEARHGFAAVEEALSGRGLEAIYAFVSGTDKPASELMAGLGSDPRVDEALALFTGIMGRVAGNLTLIHLPFGGVYFVGGVARHTVPHLAGHGFEEAFLDKGRFSDFMRQFPVHAVEDDYAALTGCAAHMVEVMAG
ncbi:glucokinase [Roseobacteraceae bacterium S113]